MEKKKQKQKKGIRIKTNEVNASGILGRQEPVLNFFLSVWCMKNIVFKKQNTWLLAAFFSNIFFALGYSHRPFR